MKMLKLKPIATVAALTAGLLFAAPVNAAPFADDDKDEKEEAAEEDEDEDEDKYLAIVGGDIFTGTGAVLRGATLLAKNGVIEGIGYDDLFIPEDTEKIDARGMRVYPGLVALNATSRVTRGLFAPDMPAKVVNMDPHLGIDSIKTCPCGGNLADGADHSKHWEEIFTDPSYLEEPLAVDRARQKVEDAFDPYSEYMVLALATGITAVEQSNSAVKLRRGEFKGTYMGQGSMTSVSWTRRSPSSIRSTREKFAKAAEYLREYRNWEDLGDKDVKEPSSRGVDTSALRILKGETLARFNANDRDTILSIARFAQQYGFRPVIVGCREGWTVAQELGRAGAFAIITPRDKRLKDESFVRAGGSSIENAAILHQSGVQVAVVPPNGSFDIDGTVGRDLMHLPTEAGFAVRGGMSDAAALQAITLVPARLLGVDHRVGSIEVGKDCDVVITDGDILHYQTFVQYAVVLGEQVYDKEEEIFFAHIRPRPQLAPLDPGELREEEPATEEAVEDAPEKEATEEKGDEEPEKEADDDKKEDEKDDGKEKEKGDGKDQG